MSKFVRLSELNTVTVSDQREALLRQVNSYLKNEVKTAQYNSRNSNGQENLSLMNFFTNLYTYQKDTKPDYFNVINDIKIINLKISKIDQEISDINESDRLEQTAKQEAIQQKKQQRTTLKLQLSELEDRKKLLNSQIRKNQTGFAGSEAWDKMVRSYVAPGSPIYTKLKNDLLTNEKLLNSAFNGAVNFSPDRKSKPFAGLTEYFRYNPSEKESLEREAVSNLFDFSTGEPAVWKWIEQCVTVKPVARPAKPFNTLDDPTVTPQEKKNIELSIKENENALYDWLKNGVRNEILRLIRKLPKQILEQSTEAPIGSSKDGDALTLADTLRAKEEIPFDVLISRMLDAHKQSLESRGEEEGERPMDAPLNKLQSIAGVRKRKLPSGEEEEYTPLDDLASLPSKKYFGTLPQDKQLMILEIPDFRNCLYQAISNAVLDNQIDIPKILLDIDPTLSDENISDSRIESVINAQPHQVRSAVNHQLTANIQISDILHMLNKVVHELYEETEALSPVNMNTDMYELLKKKQQELEAALLLPMPENDPRKAVLNSELEKINGRLSSHERKMEARENHDLRNQAELDQKREKKSQIDGRLGTLENQEAKIKQFNSQIELATQSGLADDVERLTLTRDNYILEHGDPTQELIKLRDEAHNNAERITELENSNSNIIASTGVKKKVKPTRRRLTQTQINEIQQRMFGSDDLEQTRMLALNQMPLIHSYNSNDENPERPMFETSHNLLNLSDGYFTGVGYSTKDSGKPIKSKIKKLTEERKTETDPAKIEEIDIKLKELEHNLLQNLTPIELYIKFLRTKLSQTTDPNEIQQIQSDIAYYEKELEPVHPKLYEQMVKDYDHEQKLKSGIPVQEAHPHEGVVEWDDEDSNGNPIHRKEQVPLSLIFSRLLMRAYSKVHDEFMLHHLTDYDIHDTSNEKNNLSMGEKLKNEFIRLAKQNPRVNHGRGAAVMSIMLRAFFSDRSNPIIEDGQHKLNMDNLTDRYQQDMPLINKKKGDKKNWHALRNIKETWETMMRASTYAHLLSELFQKGKTGNQYKNFAQLTSQDIDLIANRAYSMLFEKDHQRPFTCSKPQESGGEGTTVRARYIVGFDKNFAEPSKVIAAMKREILRISENDQTRIQNLERHENKKQAEIAARADINRQNEANKKVNHLSKRIVFDKEKFDKDYDNSNPKIMHPHFDWTLREDELTDPEFGFKLKTNSRKTKDTRTIYDSINRRRFQKQQPLPAQAPVQAPVSGPPAQVQTPAPAQVPVQAPVAAPVAQAPADYLNYLSEASQSHFNQLIRVATKLESEGRFVEAEAMKWRAKRLVECHKS